MIRKAAFSQRAFTLAEIMIAVAIIAILATLAIPAVLRAQRRSAAAVNLSDIRLYNETVEQWMAENSLKPPLEAGYAAKIAEAGYFKAGTRFANKNFTDTLGELYLDDNSDGHVSVSPSTLERFKDIVPEGFWAGYDVD